VSVIKLSPFYCNKDKARFLYNIKKELFHVSSLKKMGSYQHLVLLAAFMIFHCGFVESRGIRGDPADGSNTDVRNNILQIILQNQGTSLDQIHDRINAAGGNLEEAVSGINSEFKEKILSIDGDLVRVDPESLKQIVRNATLATIRNRFSQNSPLTSILEKSVNEQINAQSPQINALVEQSTVHRDVAQQWLESKGRSRSRRSLQPRAFDLGQIATDIILNILRDQFSSVIIELLENLKNTLSAWYIGGPPANDFEGIFALAVNTLIQNAIQLITAFEESLKSTVPVVPEANSVSTDTAEGRKKREVQELAAVEDNNDGLLDGIIRPILTLLASFLTPVNTLVKDLASAIFDILSPILGNIIITRIRNIVIPIIDLLLPANPI
jgi:hypothetical protein